MTRSVAAEVTVSLPESTVTTARTGIPADVVGHRGVKVHYSVAGITGTAPTITFTLQIQNPITKAWSNLLVSAAVAANGIGTLTVYPGIAAAANVSGSDHVGRRCRVITTPGGTVTAVTTSAAIEALP